MGREVRRVPADWKHPRNGAGGYAAMRAEDMPAWPDAARTHWQLYETTSAGTPKSPPMPTARDLARWLAEHSTEVGPGFTATEAEWLAMIEGSGKVAATFHLEAGVFVSPLAKPPK